MIYFLQPTDGGPIKIGFSDNVDARVRQLEWHYGRPLALLGTMEGGREEETEIHSRFAHLRLGRTEQFRPASELLAFIGRPLLIGANPDAVEMMDAEAKAMAIQVRGSDAWKAWAEELAQFDTRPVAALVDRALRRYAREIGFPKEAPER
jgi:hypothetical protein